MKWMTAADSLDRKPETFENSVFIDGLFSVL